MLSVVMFLVVAAATFGWAASGEFRLVGAALLGLLGVKLALAMCYRPMNGRPAPTWRTVLVVPVYNEDPGTLARCLASVLTQDRLPQSVIVVDDGSTTRTAADRAEELSPAFAQRGTELVVLRQPANRGKRQALARAFLARPDASVYITVDSDTVLHPRAVAELLVPMRDEHVTAVTGLVLVANHRANVLTRLIELRYANAFLYERAAYSVVGSVLCCCGSLAAYRGTVVRAHLDDFLTQRFLGRRALIGDDRRLTNYCLLEGRVLLQSSALAETVVPQRLGHYLRQQARWNRSFFRESLWSLRRFPLRRPTAWTLSAVELTTWLAFTGTLLYALTIYPLTSGRVPLPEYATMIITLGYLRSVRYLDLRRPSMSRTEQWLIYAIAPLYGLFHIILLLPVRVFSMLTPHRTAWGTRRTIEVPSAAGPAQDIAGPGSQ